MTAVPVAVHGFTWTAGLVGLLNVLFAGALVTWVKTRPKMKQLEADAEKVFRDDVVARVRIVEEALETQRSDYERRLAEKDANYEAQIRVMRHELNNVRTCFDALMLLLKRMPDAPEQLATIISDIEAMRARQMNAEAQEKGTFLAAKFPAQE